MIGNLIGTRVENHIPLQKYIIAKAKNTYFERQNRDFRTHLKRLSRETVCFSKKDDRHCRIIKGYIFLRNKFGSLVKLEHIF